MFQGYSGGVYVVNADGTALTRLTEAGHYPVWSPDARRIAFEPDSGMGISVIYPDGSGLRTVGAAAAAVGDLAWSPDGSKIAFDSRLRTATGWSGEGLTIVDVDGTQTNRVDAAGPILQFSWSPDGQKIAYALNGGEPGLYVVDVDTGASATLGVTSGRLLCFSWSPNGARVAAQGYDPPPAVARWLGVIDVATGRVTKLVTGLSSHGCPQWSLDGTTLAYANLGLRLIDVASGKISKLTDGGSDPVWSPDGTRIAFLRGGFLLTISRGGRAEHRLTSVGEDAGNVSWSQDGRILVFEKQRYAGSPSTDIWRIRADGTGAVALSPAFPTGESYYGAGWAATTIRPRATETTPPWVSLQPSRVLTTPAPVLDIAADDRRVAVVTQLPGDAPSYLTSQIEIWNRLGGLSPLAGLGCESTSVALAFAGGRAAEICDNGAAPPTYTLTVAAQGSRLAQLESVYVGGAMNGGAGADDIGNLAGDGNLLVYNTWWSPFDHRTETWGSPMKRKLWRVVGTATKQLLAAGTDALDVVSVDAGRIAVLRPDGTIVILNDHGKRLSAYRLGSRSVHAVRMTGTKLVVLRGETVEVRDATKGTLIHQWPTAPSASGITLEDAQGNVAAYTAGIAIHLLRLSDGHDRVLKIAGQGEPAHVDLEPDGLYYSYNKTGSSKPGRVAFVPFAELTARLK